MYYQTNIWNFPNFTEGEVRNRLLCEPSTSREDSSKLSFHDRLAHFLLTKLVLPRDGHHTTVQKMDLFLLHHLKEEIQVNLAHIIICHIAAAADHTSRSLPYGSLLTAIFQHFNFALERELPKKNTKLIDSSTFTSIGFKKNQYGQWVRKNIRDTPEDQGGTPNGFRFRGFSYSRTRKKDHLSGSRFFSSDVNCVTTDEEEVEGEREEAGREDVQQEAPMPSPRHAPPPCDPYPTEIDIRQRFDRLENQVYQRLNRMDHMLDRMENQWNALFELSSAFYAAYGPRASQPSPSTASPSEATTSQDKDDQDGGGED
ncbi:uncharacterized protein LOC109704071 [Ananas comosus]|uniref:Uncharacterized protein LOC109704071 n=1 Tax=Ananas comosus TaxID=4615 RepID=A0A6P5EAT6_ANACO|nr:uncharacterized protein LOC109704071 [Ananas comosus]